MSSKSERISPTAYYTGHVWVRAGLAPKEFANAHGRVLHGLMRGPVQLSSMLTDGLNLDGMLLQRHAILDHQTMRSIEQDGYGQVIELAAGLSPRGLTMRRRFPHARYIEVDLPEMSGRKRVLLERVRGMDDEHKIVSADLFSSASFDSDGPIEEILDTYGIGNVPTLFITEGLLNYFPREEVERLWARIAKAGRTVSRVRYISDLHLGSDIDSEPLAQLFIKALGRFAGSSISTDFENSHAALKALLSAGFSTAEITTPEDWRRTLALPSSRRQPVLRMIYAEREGTDYASR